MCGHQFTREPGYFQGAMYVSYAMAIGMLAVLTLVVELLAPVLPPLGALAISLPIFLLLVPLLFRYSRVIWMHLNYWAF